jgi:hypothetical protein
MSLVGTLLPIWNVRATVAIRGKADVFCSDGALPGLTRWGLKPARNAAAHQSSAAPDVLSWRLPRREDATDRIVGSRRCHG